MTPRQEAVLRAFVQRSAYFQLSASEAGDPEIQSMFDDGLVDSYWGGGMMWHLTEKGCELATRLLQQREKT